MTKVLRTNADYERALARIADLIGAKPTARGAARDELELLAILVEEYEKQTRPRLPADPVDAIRFRMDQLGLKQGDLVPLLGARSRVSEILSRKRALTLDMMRGLNEHLGIPWESLTSAHDTTSADAGFWNSFPVAALRARGWISVNARASAKAVREALDAFFAPVGGPEAAVALYRHAHARLGRQVDRMALTAWTTRLITLGATIERHEQLPDDKLRESALIELVRVSRGDAGPTAAYHWLRSQGVVLIYLPHLPGTHLDGAAVRLKSGRGVIGLTARHDRLDNFWFTVLHECVHLLRHLVRGTKASLQPFVDDLDIAVASDPREAEADAVAGETLLPQHVWEQSAVRSIPAAPTAVQLAEQLCIHPAIVAGRVRRELNNYRLLSGLVGQGGVRKELSLVQPEYVS